MSYLYDLLAKRYAVFFKHSAIDMAIEVTLTDIELPNHPFHATISVSKQNFCNNEIMYRKVFPELLDKVKEKRDAYWKDILKNLPRDPQKDTFND